MKPGTRELLDGGRLEEVPPDRTAAEVLIEEAERHLRSAELILPIDADGAYSLLYDAARKAVTAVLWARGLRVCNRQGAHAAVVLYAEGELGGEDVAALERMRRTRNRSEYRATPVGERQARADLRHAGGIVALARTALA